MNFVVQFKFLQNCDMIDKSIRWWIFSERPYGVYVILNYDVLGHLISFFILFEYTNSRIYNCYSYRFNPVVGGGPNGSVIHYSRNDQKVWPSIECLFLPTLDTCHSSLQMKLIIFYLIGQRWGPCLDGYWMWVAWLS